MELAEKFAARAGKYEQIFKSYEQKHKWISTLRLLLFVFSIILIVVFANQNYLLGILSVLFVFPFVFGFLIKYHTKIRQLRNLAKSIADINNHEIQRLNGDFSQLYGAEEFKDSQHPYINDLDIFGKKSVFQLLNRAVTPSGISTLADWLKHPASISDIKKRQQAVEELKERVDWRQDLQAKGMSSVNESNSVTELIQWVEEDPKLINNGRYKSLAYIMPIITCSIITLAYIIGGQAYTLLFVPLIINTIILKKYAIYSIDLAERTSQSFRVLKAYAGMIGLIEKTEFQSEYLAECKSVFFKNNISPSHSILKLGKLLDLLNGRANLIYVILNTFFAIDLHILLAAEKWKEAHKQHLASWFDALGQIESICSIAGYAFANPEYAVAEITEAPYTFKATSLGHPLIISAEERVCNDIVMQGKGHINIITGSNMSGKSTFLRTVSINMVLALMGAPVCAQEMKTSIFQVFTSMRTEDNLDEHVSSFYAELKRIQQLLKLLATSQKPVMYMLDEILKGTNSKDRNLGAISLIKQLSPLEAMGFVSTHDLELATLSKQMSNVENFSFNSSIVNDEIIFKYKMEAGPCYSFNASKLMEKIGIKIEKDQL